MKLRPNLLLAAALACLSPLSRAQNLKHDVGAWFALAGQGHLERGGEESRWRWWFDAHARFFDDSDGFGQSIVRPGLGYDLSENSTAWLGYGWILTDPVSAPAFDEHRIWQQYTWSSAQWGGSFYGRSRLEQRFVETGDDVGWRFRQFARYTRPLEEGSGLALRVWDEVFLALNDTDWGANAGLDQNRLFAGLGWTFEDREYATLEFGYLNQYSHREAGRDGMNHILAVTLLLSP